MHHVGFDVQRYIDTSGAPPLCQSDGVVSEQLGIAYHHEQARQAFKLCVHRRDFSIGSVARTGVHLRPSESSLSKSPVHVSVRGPARAGPACINHGRKQDCSRRDWLTGIAKVNERRKNDATARRKAHEHNVLMPDVTTQMFINGDYILNIRRVRRLRCEPKVRSDNPSTRKASQL